MNKKQCAIIGVPIDMGGRQPGVYVGPIAIRAANIMQKIKDLGWDVIDLKDLHTPKRDEAVMGNPRKKYATAIKKVCDELFFFVEKILKEKRLPLILGGDHSLSMGSIAAVSSFYRKQKKKIGLIWFDAHGDMNTPETTPSGNIHGMPLAHTLGLGDQKLASIGGFIGKVDPKNTVLIGSRDIDDKEKDMILKSGITAFTMREIDQFGIVNVVNEAIRRASKNTCGFHVSFDIDTIDPQIAPAAGTPVGNGGGLSYREAHLCMELISESKKLLSLDMVEINPLSDIKNMTAKLAVDLILSALGKKIISPFKMKHSLK